MRTNSNVFVESQKYRFMKVKEEIQREPEALAIAGVVTGYMNLRQVALWPMPRLLVTRNNNGIAAVEYRQGQETEKSAKPCM